MTLKRFVELVRVSSEGQASRDTPEDQRRALDALRRSRPGLLVERIDGPAVSGAKSAEARVDIRRLGELARQRAFDEVRVRHLDRLTRHDDPRERFTIFGIIADADAIIVDTTGRELDPKTEMGELTYFFETLMASKERRRITERTQAGKERAIRNGRLAEGRVPYGRTYDKRDGKWGLDAPKVSVYRELFKRYLAGQSLGQIAKLMQAKGAPAPVRGPWNIERVRKLLRHPSAIGKYTRKGVTFEIPAIVDADTQAKAVGLMRTKRNWTGPKPTVNALLRKVLRCGECKKTMYVRGPAVRRYYTCSVCGTSHRLSAVDAAVKGILRDFILDPRIAKMATEGLKERSVEPAAEQLADAERELKGLDRQEENLARLLRKGLIQVRTGEQQLQEVLTLRADAEQRLEEARVLSNNQELARDRAGRVKDLRKRIGASLKADAFESWRTLLLDLPFGVEIQPAGELSLVVRDEFKYQPVSGRR